MSSVDKATVKARLNKSAGITVDDNEIDDMIGAALAYYERQIGPVDTKTKRYDGSPGNRIVLPVTATAVTEVAYTDGTAIDVADLEFDSDSQMLGWEYGTTGYFARGSRNVLVTFTAAMPADHVEIVVGDVAGYFAASQHSTGAGQADFPGEGLDAPFHVSGGVITFWPRIDALAKQDSLLA